MIRRFYNLVFPFVFLLLLPGFLRRMFRRGNYRDHFWQRFGYYDRATRAHLAAQPGRPWLQAVSVGEMIVALKLLAAWRAREPERSFILSTTTTTGFALAKERAPQGVDVIYTPVDWLPAVRRAFALLRPIQFIVVDGGLWPNMLWEARAQSVPTALVNARLSPRSERRFRQFRGWSAPMFRALDIVGVPEVSDVARWQALGIAAERIRVTGSVKFDDESDAPMASAVRAEIPHILAQIEFPPDAPTLLAGSTHPGEEAAIADVFVRLRERFADLRLIVAPRHAERAGEVRAELERRGLRVANRSRIEPSPADALLLDTTGELGAWYTAATLVFVGKSLVGIGGHNPAEAIAADKPVLFGPHMENFADLTAALLQVSGAIQVANAGELVAECARLLADPAESARLVAAGRKVIGTHRGAAGRTADLLTDLANFPLASEGERSHIHASIPG